MSSPAASSSTARENSGSPTSLTRQSDALGRSDSKKTTASKSNMTSGHRSTASRMPRTLNTIPSWARHDPPSPPSSPHRSNSPETNSKQIPNTWPKAPKPAFLQSSSRYDARSSSSASTSSQEEVGPSRFWSFTLPSSMRGGNAGGANTTKGRNASDETSTEAEGHGPDQTRKASTADYLTTALGGAFANLAFGSRSRQSAVSEHEEKDAEQGDVEPDIDWTDDTDVAHRSQETKPAAQKRQLEVDTSFSRHQQITPGWESPWRPESRGGHSIEFGNYRFNNHGEGGYFPRTETYRSNQSRKRRQVSNGMTILHGKEKSNSGGAAATVDWWKHFLLYNPLVPLLFRLINVGFTTATLAIAIKLHLLLRSEGAEDSVGSSPIVAIVFAPLTLVHVGVQIWLEYFSRPIGLWQVGSKLFYTLIELVFVCFWSAELSLSFDNYFTSTLVCTTLDSPYASQVNGSQAVGQQILPDPSKKPIICRLQGALIGLVFTSLLAYIVVLSVSLFRIFVRVSRR